MNDKAEVSKSRRWISYILQGIVILMFLLGAFNNIMQTEAAVEGATQLGYPKSSVLYLGIILLLATILYAIPKTSFLGALLLTAWLGGAVASHVIHEDPLANTLLPVVFGLVIWTSIWLRDPHKFYLFMNMS